MSVYSDQIEMMMYDNQCILEKYIQEYERCVNGGLACCKVRGKDTFYHTYQQDGRYVRSTINRDSDVIKELARKEYLEQSIKVLEHNVKVLTKATGSLKPTDFETIRSKMAKVYRRLPDEYFFGEGAGSRALYLTDNFAEGIKRHESWAKEPYEKSTYKPEQKKFPTSAGFKVRSKSELYIVEKLFDYGVPFRYEEVIRINNKKFAPDLTFRGFDMECYYWEHAGMMSIPSYAAHHKWKMDMYERSGIVPWKNLIITYDDVDGVINAPLIKSIIEYEVLPRL